jgi:hypothetical protein
MITVGVGTAMITTEVVPVPLLRQRVAADQQPLIPTLPTPWEAAASVVVVTFSSRHAAEAFQDNVQDNAANKAAAIELVGIRVLEVMASA